MDGPSVVLSRFKRTRWPVAGAKVMAQFSPMVAVNDVRRGGHHQRKRAEGEKMRVFWFHCICYEDFL